MFNSSNAIPSMLAQCSSTLFSVLFCIVVVVVINQPQDVAAIWSDFELQTVENINSTDSMPLIFDLAVKRVRKGVYGISGTLGVTDNFDGYTAEVLVFHSVDRNNNYKLIALRIPEGPLCDKIQSEYRKYLMKDLHSVSDLPYSDNNSEDLCPMFVKGAKHDIKSFEFDKGTLPRFLQTGAYKAHILFRKDGVVRSGVAAFVDLS